LHKNQKNEADEKKRKNNSIEENNMIKEKFEYYKRKYKKL